MRRKTFRIVDWSSRPPEVEDGEPVPLDCPECGQDRDCPSAGQPGAAILATWGLHIVFDPPDHKPLEYWLPDEIQCRGCRTIFSKGA